MAENNTVEEAIKAAKEEEAKVKAEKAEEEAVEEETTSEEAEAEETEAEEAEAEEAEEADAEGKIPEGRDKFFKKKSKKDKKDEMIEELNDKVKRQMAEFDNFRKRTEKEKSQMYEIGAKSIVEKILPIIDNFERGLATATDKADPFVDGMDKIYKQLVSSLEEAGVKEIECLGMEFDPNFHNAVMHVEDEEAGENVIVEVFQKGYTYKDTVVRHSMVKVAN